MCCRRVCASLRVCVCVFQYESLFVTDCTESNTALPSHIIPTSFYTRPGDKASPLHSLTLGSRCKNSLRNAYRKSSYGESLLSSHLAQQIIELGMFDYMITASSRC